MIRTKVIPVAPGVSFTRDRFVEVPIECNMERNGTGFVSFHPETTKIIYREEGFGKFIFELQLYPNKTYGSPYLPDAYPIEVSLKDRLYFEASVSAEDWLELFVDTCVATLTLDPYSTPQFRFIHEG